MKYFIDYDRVTKKEVKEYVEKIWGKGTLAKREKEAKQYFSEECDNVCSWMDGLAIQRGDLK